jgi:hypothetical protein
MKSHVVGTTVVAMCIIGLTAGGQMNVSSQRGLQHFDPQVLGASVDDPITPLRRLRPTDLSPSEVRLTVENKAYVRATLTFPKDISTTDAVASIQRTFPQCKRVATSPQHTNPKWSDDTTGFTVVLIEKDDAFDVVYSGVTAPRRPTLKDLPETETKFNLKTL